MTRRQVASAWSWIARRVRPTANANNTRENLRHGITISSNVVQSSNQAITKIAAADVSSSNNFVGQGSTLSEGVTEGPLGLIQEGDVWRIGSMSPAVDHGSNVFSFLTQDIEGSPRVVVPDAGAHESGGMGTLGPLSKVTWVPSRREILSFSAPIVPNS